jgi:tRNA-dihydrouridine synthase
VKDWLGLHDVNPSSWHTKRSIKDWWMKAIHKQGQFKKAVGSIAMLISWELRKKRNARVFWNISTSNIDVNKIKEEFALWS